MAASSSSSEVDKAKQLLAEEDELRQNFSRGKFHNDAYKSLVAIGGLRNLLKLRNYARARIPVNGFLNLRKLRAWRPIKRFGRPSPYTFVPSHYINPPAISKRKPKGTPGQIEADSKKPKGTPGQIEADSKKHYITDSIDIEADPFLAMIDKLPQNLKECVTVAGGAIVSQIWGKKPSDYDLFLVTPKHSEFYGKPENLITELLNKWQSKITYVSRSGNAISLNMNLNSTIEPEPEPDPEADPRIIEARREIADIDLLNSRFLAQQLTDPADPNNFIAALTRIYNWHKERDIYRQRIKQVKMEFEVKRIKSHAAAKYRAPKKSKPKTKVQIILRVYHTPSEVVHGFDLDPSGLIYHNGRYYITKRALHSIETMTLYIALSRASTTYNLRLVKYMKKYGFRIYSPIEITTQHIVSGLDIYNNRSAYRQFLEGYLIGLIANIKMKPSDRIRIGGTSDYVDAETGTKHMKTDNKIFLIRKGKDIVYYGFNPDRVPISNIVYPKITGVRLPKIEFITVEPGRQWTGSFHPMNLKLKEWSNPYLPDQ